MARVIGSNAGGYATVTPTEDYVGQAIQNKEANDFKYREEQRNQEAKKAALAKAKADALDKQADEDLKDADRLDSIRAKDSGISGIDSAVVNGMAGERQKYIDATRKYRATGDKKYLIERSAAMNNLQSIANIPTSYQKVIDLTTQGIANGTLDKSEEKRITSLGDKIEKGFVVPKIENGIMTFDVFERDPNTGELSKAAIKNMKGEELINQLTPQKKFDYNKHIKEVQDLAGPPVTTVKNGIETTGVPGIDKYAENKARDLLSNQDLFDNIAQRYGIEEDPKTGYSDQDKNTVLNKYAQEILSGFSTGSKPNYEGARFNLAQQKENRQAAKDAKEAGPTGQTVDVSVQAANYDPALGQKVAPGTYKLSFVPTPKSNVKGVHFDPKKKAWIIYEQNLKNAALTQAGRAKRDRNKNQTDEKLIEEYDPNVDFINPENSTRVIRSDVNRADFNNALRTIQKPNSKEAYSSFKEFYDTNAPAVKKTHNEILAGKRAQAKTATTPKAKTPAKATAKKTYAGVDENGKIIWK
jgi:hypothetical protein